MRIPSNEYTAKNNENSERTIRLFLGFISFSSLKAIFKYNSFEVLDSQSHSLIPHELNRTVIEKVIKGLKGKQISYLKLLVDFNMFFYKRRTL